uniref:Uncharacterized protein n=1 Tax=Meloidogyne enterolobii TaxID=390850 RepID=A0A6V7U6W8_MELEN|nr:unnamed protein product [Meloidogyne enterolobii]
MLYLKIIIIILLLFFIKFVEQQKPLNISSSKNNFLKQQFIQQFRSKTSNSIIINNTTKRLKFNNNRRIPEGNILPRIKNLKPQTLITSSSTLINKNNQIPKITKFTKTIILPIQTNNKLRNPKIIPKVNTPSTPSQRLFLQSLLNKKQKERNNKQIQEQQLNLELKRRQKGKISNNRNSFFKNEGKTKIGESRQKINLTTTKTTINKHHQQLPNDKRHENILLLKTKLVEDSSFEREKAKQLIRERVFSISPTLPPSPSSLSPSLPSFPSPTPTTTTTTLKPLISATTEIDDPNSLENIDEEEKEEGEGEGEELKEEEELTTTLINKSPPGMMPPNDNIVDELNNANDFMEVANRLGILEMFSTKTTTTTNIF